jgi:uroporphyrinogen decarboxylase
MISDPLLIRAANGDTTIDRTPVWMMRQAGRHIQEYRDLCLQYPTFRQRSEITEVAVEVSLQPWRNYQTDGCILFSDILTPLPGMGCDFVIDEQKGPIMMQPITSYDDLQQVKRVPLLWLLLLCVFFWGGENSGFFCFELQLTFFTSHTFLNLFIYS